MVSFKSLIVLATMASAMFIHDRDVNTILINLQKIDASAKTMASHAKTEGGTGSGLGTIGGDLKTLDDRFNSATSEAKTESRLNSADSKTVLAYVSTPLTPDFKAALDAFVSWKSDYQKSGLTGLAKSDLNSLKADVDALGNALKILASSDQQSKASAEFATLDGYLNSAIAAYS